MVAISYYLGVRRARLDRYEDERAKVIGDLSRSLFEHQNDLYRWSLLHRNREATIEAGKAAIESKNAFIRFYSASEVWIPPDIAEEIEAFIRDEVVPLTDAGRGREDALYRQEVHMLALEAHHKVADYRAHLVRKFRSILYPDDWRRKLRYKFFPYRIRKNNSDDG